MLCITQINHVLEVIGELDLILAMTRISHWIRMHLVFSLVNCHLTETLPLTESHQKGSNNRSFNNLVLDEEKMRRPDHWLGSVFLFYSVLSHRSLNHRKDI